MCVACDRGDGVGRIYGIAFFVGFGERVISSSEGTLLLRCGQDVSRAGDRASGGHHAQCGQ